MSIRIGHFVSMETRGGVRVILNSLVSLLGVLFLFLSLPLSLLWNHYDTSFTWLPLTESSRFFRLWIRPSYLGLLSRLNTIPRGVSSP